MRFLGFSISGFALLYVSVLGLIGPGLTLMFFREPPSEAYAYLLGPNSEKAVIHAYCWLLYGLLIVTLLYRIYVRREIEKYTVRPMIDLPLGHYRLYWAICVAGILSCGAILFIQNGYKHPLLDALRLSPQEYVLERIKLSYRINLMIYALGQYVFSAGALILAFRYINGMFIKAGTIVMFLWLGTFTLAKAPIAVTLLEILIVAMIHKPIRFPIGVLLLAVASIGTLFFLTSGDRSFQNTISGMTYRIFLGEFSDLATYFEVFKDNRASPLSILPPYLKSLFGVSLLSPSKLLSLPGNEVLTVGMANSFFVGEAYAVGGLVGAVLSPFIVTANVIIIVRYFTRIPKTFFNASVFGYLAFKLLTGLFSGISVYLLSSVQLILLAHMLLSWVFPSRLRPGDVP